MSINQTCSFCNKEFEDEIYKTINLRKTRNLKIIYKESFCLCYDCFKEVSDTLHYLKLNKKQKTNYRILMRDYIDFNRSDRAEHLFKYLYHSLKNSYKIELSFKDVTLITSCYLNESIGRLYKEFDSGFLKEHIVITNASQDILQVLKRVCDNAKKYFLNSKENSI